MKIYISKQEDRENVAIALIRNGYTVKFGADKRRLSDSKKSSFIKFDINSEEEERT